MAKKITFKLGSSLQTEKGTNMQNFTNPTRLKETALMWEIFVAKKSLIKGFCIWRKIIHLIFFMKYKKDKKLFRSFYRQEFLNDHQSFPLPFFYPPKTKLLKEVKFFVIIFKVEIF